MLDSINTSSMNFQEPSIKARCVRSYVRKCRLRPSNNPLVHVISNMLGSMPLDDEATRFFFVQTFTSCNGKYKELFHNIKCDAEIIQEAKDFGDIYNLFYSFFIEFH
ncbi:hypothetical protein PAEPH01_1676 [Pancytospora epiphaga]|nr:hypothetical protein PAEPH01_1676 [Pancytospora epiphaga]